MKYVYVLILSMAILGYSAPTLAQSPSVVSVSPDQNQLALAQSVNVSATFDTDMDEATITSSSFLVGGSSSGPHAGLISYDGPSRTATLDPSVDFAAGEVVTVILTQYVESSGGVPLASSYSWSFTVDVVGYSIPFLDPVEYVVGLNPHGVCASDLDADGDIDLVTADLTDNRLSVLLNDGSGSFGVDDTYAVGDWVRSVCAADLDGDGDVDLAAANGSSTTVSVLLGNGDGSFAGQIAYSCGSGPHSIVAVDLDGDGDADLATANYTGASISVLLNDGSGSFPAYTDYTAGSGPLGICAGDLDGDGDIDLVSANRHSDNITVSLNIGDGSFGAAVGYSAGTGPRSVYAGDLDGDGDLDLVSANEYSNNLSVFVNSGGGSFAPGVIYPVGNGPHSILAVDLDGDGDLDIAASNVFSNNVSVYLNAGDATLGSYTTYTTGIEPLAVVAADLDNDNDLELITANFNGGSVTIMDDTLTLLISPVDLAFTAPSGGPNPTSQSISVESYGEPIEVDLSESADWLSLSAVSGTTPMSVDVSVDVTGLAVGHYSTSIAVTSGQAANSPQAVTVGLSVLPSNSEIGSTQPAKNELSVDPSSLIEVEFTLDMNATTITASTFLAKGSSSGPIVGVISYDGPSRTATLDPPIDFAAGEVVMVSLTRDIETSDGFPLENSYLWSFTVDVGETSIPFFDPVEYAVGLNPHGVCASDLDGDGDIDLVTADLTDNRLSVLLNTGSGSLGVDDTYAVGDWVRSVCAADLDGDGDIDLAAANGSSTTVSVLLGNGDGSFAGQIAHSCGSGPHSIVAVDLDGDGDQDLATSNYTGASVSVLWNAGDGSFAGYVDLAAGDGPLGICAGDLDGDGDIDLASANRHSDNVTVHRNNGDGSFAPQLALSAGDGPRSVYAGDLDADGDLDLVSANEYSDNLSVFVNSGGGSFAPGVIYPVGNGPHSILATDLDGDGDLDVATSNVFSDNVSVYLNAGDATLGSYTTYTTGIEPVAVVAADLDNDNDLELVTADFNGGSVSVLDGYSGPISGELVFPSVADLGCSFCDAGKHLEQPVACILEKPAVGATVSLAIPDGIEACGVSFEGLLTESWYFKDAVIKQDSGFLTVYMANSSGERIPADSEITLFMVEFGALSECPESYYVHWDTALMSDRSRATKFSDTLFETFTPAVDAGRDSTEILGYTPGDLDSAPGIDIGDVTTLIGNMFISLLPVCQRGATDVNGDCAGPDIGDLTKLISRLFINLDLELQCGCITEGAPPALDIAPEVVISVSYVDGNTVIALKSAENLQGLQLELMGAELGVPKLLVENNLDLVYGRSNEILHLGVFDPKGMGTIQIGETKLLEVTGHLEIVSAVIADSRFRSKEPVIASTSRVSALPSQFELSQNYPNPFNPVTEIELALPCEADVTLVVYNVMGQKVTTLAEGRFEAGIHTLVWDATDYSSGVYFYRLEAGTFVETKKMVLLK
jgi:hypothetical protein